MGHALTAYLGMYAGKERIADAIDDPDICLLALNAMLESAEALCRKYGVPLNEVLQHIQDLLARFTNRSLGDTCARVGADIVRKLSPQDRLIGAAQLCREQGMIPAYICVGAAGALYEYLKENGLEQTQENAESELSALSGLTDETLRRLILRYYAQFAANETIAQLRRAAQAAKAELNPDAV